MKRALHFDDSLLALLTTGMLGVGMVLALAGAASGSLPPAAVGAVLSGAALVLIIAAGWVDAMMLVLLAAPLPALLNTGLGGVRIAAVAPVCAAVLLGWVIQVLPSRRHMLIAGTLPIRSTVALVLAFMLVTLTAQNHGTAIREDINLATLLGFLVVCIATMIERPALRERAADVIAWIAGASGYIGILEMLTVIPNDFPRYETAFHRAAATFGHPNALGLFLVVAIPFCVRQLRVARTPGQRTLAALCCFGAVAGLFATFSRSSWLALLGGSTALLLLGERRHFVRLWIGVLVACAGFEVVSGGMLTNTFTRSLSDWSVVQRFLLMYGGLVMFLEHPLVGVGPGNYASELQNVGAQLSQLVDYQDTPHNAFIQMAAETGVIGLIAFVVFEFEMLRRALKAAKAARAFEGAQSLEAAALWSCAGIVVIGLGVWPYQHGAGQIVMVVFALVLTAPRERA